MLSWISIPRPWHGGGGRSTQLILVRRVCVVGRLIVIEGLDGSGKRTLAESLATAARGRGQRVATLAFPRYGVGVHAGLVRDALYGRLGDVSDSVYGMALLFALDRRDALPDIRRQAGFHRLTGDELSQFSDESC